MDFRVNTIPDYLGLNLSMIRGDPDDFFETIGEEERITTGDIVAARPLGTDVPPLRIALGRLGNWEHVMYYPSTDHTELTQNRSVCRLMSGPSLRNIEIYATRRECLRALRDFSQKRKYDS